MYKHAVASECEMRVGCVYSTIVAGIQLIHVGKPIPLNALLPFSLSSPALASRSRRSLSTIWSDKDYVGSIKQLKSHFSCVRIKHLSAVGLHSSRSSSYTVWLRTASE